MTASFTVTEVKVLKRMHMVVRGMYLKCYLVYLVIQFYQRMYHTGENAFSTDTEMHSGMMQKDDKRHLTGTVTHFDSH